MDYLFEVGPTEAGGFGPAPLSWQELEAWQLSMGRRLQPWEVRMIRRLSIEYINELAEAENPDRPAPYAFEATEVEKIAVGSTLRNALRRTV